MGLCSLDSQLQQTGRCLDSHRTGFVTLRVKHVVYLILSGRSGSQLPTDLGIGLPTVELAPEGGIAAPAPGSVRKGGRTALEICEGFVSCSAPIRAGEPGSESKFDRDCDGVGCG